MHSGWKFTPVGPDHLDHKTYPIPLLLWHFLISPITRKKAIFSSAQISSNCLKILCSFGLHLTWPFSLSYQGRKHLPCHETWSLYHTSALWVSIPSNSLSPIPIIASLFPSRQHPPPIYLLIWLSLSCHIHCFLHNTAVLWVLPSSNSLDTVLIIALFSPAYLYLLGLYSPFWLDWRISLPQYLTSVPYLCSVSVRPT